MADENVVPEENIDMKARCMALVTELNNTQHKVEEQQLRECGLLRKVEKLEKMILEAETPPPMKAMPEMTMDLDTDAKAVQQALRHFLKVYYKFKDAYNLPHTVDDPRDEALGLIDKAARVARAIKHNERADPLPDWEMFMEQNMFGTLAYLVMISFTYDRIWDKGVIAELKKAVEQHARKG